jgi:hypothetical protein
MLRAVAGSIWTDRFGEGINGQVRICKKEAGLFVGIAADDLNEASDLHELLQISSSETIFFTGACGFQDGFFPLKSRLAGVADCSAAAAQILRWITKCVTMGHDLC